MVDAREPADAEDRGDLGQGGADGGTPGRIPGTVSLFDGTTLTGWVQSGNNWWTVKDGALDGRSTTGGQVLMSVEDYGDFRLLVSVRMPLNLDGKGHLGICFWGGRTPIGGYNRCKLYVPPNAGDWDYSTGGRLKGVTVAVQDPPLTTTSPLDPKEWHQVEMLCRVAAGHCEVAVDGRPIMTYTEVKAGSVKKGPIGLQIHNGNSEVQYKDIYVDPAPPGDKLLTLNRR